MFYIKIAVVVQFRSDVVPGGTRESIRFENFCNEFSNKMAKYFKYHALLCVFTSKWVFSLAAILKYLKFWNVCRDIGAGP